MKCASDGWSSGICEPDLLSKRLIFYRLLAERDASANSGHCSAQHERSNSRPCINRCVRSKEMNSCRTRGACKPEEEQDPDDSPSRPHTTSVAQILFLKRR